MTAPAFEVWGDPIDHSLSPALHRAAYAHLGWDWTYDRRRVTESEFAPTLAGLSAHHRGLSVTFPLKGAAFAASTRRDRRAELTGAVNTLLLTHGGPVGHNTDVGGIVNDLADHGIDCVDAARIVGAGATATSAVVAAAEIGVTRLDVVARRPEAAAPLVRLGTSLGLDVASTPMDAAAFRPAQLTIATLPGGAAVPRAAAEALATDGGLLYDVVYGHWPTDLAAAWTDAGATAVQGQGMLLRQAVLQIRLFATGDLDEPLLDEESVVDVMRRALVGG